MVSLVLALVAVVELACVARLCTRAAGPGRWILVVVGVGLAYDSTAFAVGALLGEGAVLHGLSVGRFVGHAVLTPLLVIWVGQRVFPALRRWSYALAAVLILWGATELVHLELTPRTYADTLRYVPATPSGPPLPALAVTVVLLIAGTALWRRRETPWPLVAAVALTVCSGAAFAVPPLGNIGEALLLAGLVTVPFQAHAPRIGVSTSAIE
ncbi:hypothetical protein [Nocardia sp. NPDC050406]|uniref:hypothetical protein n=1 Tax=Nocardia sp. NPDC050406 TaxID=3364318 RepID=UPI0037BB49E8